MEDFRKVHSISQDRLFVWKSLWKYLEWGRVSGYHQGRRNRISQVDGNSTCPLCRKRALQRNNGLCQHSPHNQTIQFLPIGPWYLSNCCPNAGGQSEWVPVSLCAGPLYEDCLGLQQPLSLPQPQSLLVFIARSYSDFSSCGSLSWGGGS